MPDKAVELDVRRRGARLYGVAPRETLYREQMHRLYRLVKRTVLRRPDVGVQEFPTVVRDTFRLAVGALDLVPPDGGGRS